MADGKWITDLTASTQLVDAARRVLALRLEVVRDYLGLALREPDKDPEYVHQLRVGTRRAGAAVEIFSRCLPEKAYEAARTQLKRLRRAAGEARDWDVFLMALTDAGQKNNRRHRAGLDFLIGYALAQRVTAQTHLEEASPDYPFAFDRLLAETAAAVDKPRDDAGTRTLLDLAAPLLFALLRDLERAAGADLSDYGRLHRVRILGKRLRYAMEVFADCFPPPFRDEFYPAVAEMQGILGRANDSYVAGQRLQALCDKTRVVRPGDWKRFRPGIEGLLKYHQQRLPEERQRFLEWWSCWQLSGRAAAFATLLQNGGKLPGAGAPAGAGTNGGPPVEGIGGTRAGGAALGSGHTGGGSVPGGVAGALGVVPGNVPGPAGKAGGGKAPGTGAGGPTGRGKQTPP